MKISLFTMGYMRHSLERAFVDASLFGFDGIEIWGGRPHAYAPDLKSNGVNDLISLSQRYNMPIVGYTPEMNAYPFNLMIGNESMRRDCLNYLKLSMDMAKQMGAAFTLISAGHAGYETSRNEYWHRLMISLRELADHAETIGHDLALEPLTHYETNVISTLDELIAALDEVNSLRLYGMCDFCPPFCNHEPIISYFERLGDRLKHVHLVDCDGQSETHLMPGDGKIPLPPLLHEIEASGYDGYCTIELVNAYMNEPGLYTSMSIERVKEMLVNK